MNFMASHDQLRDHLATFLVAYNSAKRLKTLLGLPVRRMTAIVPSPSAVASTISARQTTFRGARIAIRNQPLKPGPVLRAAVNADAVPSSAHFDRFSELRESSVRAGTLHLQFPPPRLAPATSRLRLSRAGREVGHGPRQLVARLDEICVPSGLAISTGFECASTRSTAKADLKWLALRSIGSWKAINPAIGLRLIALKNRARMRRPFDTM